MAQLSCTFVKSKECFHSLKRWCLSVQDLPAPGWQVTLVSWTNGFHWRHFSVMSTEVLSSTWWIVEEPLMLVRSWCKLASLSLLLLFCLNNIVQVKFLLRSSLRCLSLAAYIMSSALVCTEWLLEAEAASACAVSLLWNDEQPPDLQQLPFLCSGWPPCNLHLCRMFYMISLALCSSLDSLFLQQLKNSPRIGISREGVCLSVGTSGRDLSICLMLGMLSHSSP